MNSGWFRTGLAVTRLAYDPAMDGTVALVTGARPGPGAAPKHAIVGLTVQMPGGRLERAGEVAELVRFLAGPESSCCFGEVLSLAGGY
jgi:hypothetical protein